MSLTRLGLLAGSSLAAASLLSLVPSAAFAQATCTSGTAVTNNTTNAVSIAGGNPNNPGVLCNYVGDTATVTTLGAMTVSTLGGVPGDPLVNGINLRATGTDDIGWTSTAGAITGGNQTNGPVIDAQTASGNITISTGAISGFNSTITHGIYAQSAGAGNIGVTTSGTIDATASTGVGVVAGGTAAIEAISNGGSVNIATSGGQSVQGRLYGIRAQTSGSGTLTINATNSISGGNTAGLSATTGTGLLTINAAGITSSSGSALRIATGGNANIVTGALRSSGTSVAVVDLSVATGTQTNLTFSDLNEVMSNSGSGNTLAMRAQGGGNIAINSSGILGQVNFSGQTGNLTWTSTGRWTTYHDNRFSGGNDVITLASGGELLTGVESQNTSSGSLTALEPATIFDFGAGDDRFVNNGVMQLSTRVTSQFGGDFPDEFNESETRFTNLETFENASTIYLGGANRPDRRPGGIPETDRSNDDILTMPGTDFIGSGDSTIVFDVVVSASQSACDASLRNTATYDTLFTQDILTGEMPAADCLRIEGGSTAGETKVYVNNISRGDRGGTERIVLIDVEGGTSAAGHFVLDPDSPDYNPDEGGFIDLGYMIYPLVYDAASRQHALVGVAGANAWQTAGWATAAHEVWRTSTGAWFDRQADVRGQSLDGNGGIWMRASTDFASRDIAQAVMAGGNTYVFDNSYEQDTYAVTGGADLMRGGADDSAWVVGLMVGYANSELTYDASPNDTQFDTWNGGLYASLISGGLFVDALVNANKGDLKASMPALNLFPSTTLLDTRLLSVGAQLEAGWRLPMSGGVFVEPLAGVSYVRTEWDNMPVASDDPLRPGLEIEFADPTSLRANVGGRLGLDQDYGSLRAQYSVLGRVWNEFEGENQLTIHNIGDDAFVSDEFTGAMTEFGVGASLYGSVVSGFLNVGGKWADDYQSVGGAAGVRMAW